MATSDRRRLLDHAQVEVDSNCGRDGRFRAILAFLVGVSAAFENAQLYKLHAFVIIVLAWWAATHYRGILARAFWLTLPACILASTALFGPLVTSPQTGLQLLALSACGSIIAIAARSTDVSLMIRGFLCVVTLASLLGLAQYVHLLPSTPFGGENRPDGFIYSEPDFLGAYAAVAFLLILWTTYRFPTRALVFCLSGSAVLISAARASWLAAAVGGLVTALVYVLRKRTHQLHIRPIPLLLLGALAGLLALALIPSLGQRVQERVASAISGPTTVNASSDQSVVSAQARRNQIAGLMELASTAPWYGQGLTASGHVGVFGGVYDQPPQGNHVSSNWILTWWAEGQLLALPVFCLFAFAIRRGWRNGSGVVMLGLLTNNLFTNTSLMPVTWFILALCFVSPSDLRPPGADARVLPRSSESD